LGNIIETHFDNHQHQRASVHGTKGASHFSRWWLDHPERFDCCIQRHRGLKC
jgi:hypothetical protein